jgi:hypothetical protein
MFPPALMHVKRNTDARVGEKEHLSEPIKRLYVARLLVLSGTAE